MTMSPTDEETARPRARMLTGRTVGLYVGCALLFGLDGAAAGFAIAPLLPASYSAQSQVVIGSPQQPTILGNPVVATGWTDPEYATKVLASHDVAAETSKLLGGRLTADQVDGQVTVDGSSASPVVSISATADSPRLAQDLANAVPRAYVSVETRASRQRADDAGNVLNQLLTSQQQRLADLQQQMRTVVTSVQGAAAGILVPSDRASFVQATLDADIGYQALRDEATALTTQISATQEALRQATVNSGVLQSGVDQVIEAPLPGATPQSTRLRYAGIAGLIGAILGALVAWRVAESRKTVDPAVAAATLGAPCLGTVGRTRALRGLPGFVDLSEDTPLASELKVVASSLLLNAQRRELDCIVVTSAHRREGKSALARNLAAAAEYIGHPVVLVDAGFGSPTTSAALGLDDSAGLAEVVEGKPPAQVLHRVPYGDDGHVPVMSIGRNGFATEPGRRLNEERRRNWAKAMTSLRPTVPVVDTPAINEHPLALQLAGGGGLLVVVSARTTLADLEVIRTRAEVADVPLLGFVINDPPAKLRSRGTRPADVPVAGASRQGEEPADAPPQRNGAQRAPSQRGSG